jgi:hypothetical protein
VGPVAAGSFVGRGFSRDENSDGAKRLPSCRRPSRRPYGRNDPIVAHKICTTGADAPDKFTTDSRAATFRAIA